MRVTRQIVLLLLIKALYEFGCCEGILKRAKFGLLLIYWVSLTRFCTSIHIYPGTLILCFHEFFEFDILHFHEFSDIKKARVIWKFWLTLTERWHPFLAWSLWKQPRCKKWPPSFEDKRLDSCKLSFLLIVVVLGWFFCCCFWMTSCSDVCLVFREILALAQILWCKNWCFWFFMSFCRLFKTHDRFLQWLWLFWLVFGWW